MDPGDHFSWLALGDFDGDGKVDLAVGMLDAHAAWIFFNAGQVQFARSCFATGAQTGEMLPAISIASVTGRDLTD